MKTFLKKYGALLVMLFTAILVLLLTTSGGIKIRELPGLVKDNQLLSLIVVFALFFIKGLSGVILYDALIIAVSLLYPLPAAILINSLGTALTLSVSYFIGRHTDVSVIREKIRQHPKLARYVDLTKSYGFLSCFSIHLVGLNMEVLGILFGFLRMPFFTYLISSWIAIIPGTLAITIAGGTLDFRSPAFWIIAVIDVLMIAFGFYYTGRHLLGNKAPSDSPRS